MRLFILKRVGPTGYDEHQGFVVRASSEGKARALAAKESADEGPGTWLDPERTSCERLSVQGDGTSEVILSDYRAG